MATDVVLADVKLFDAVGVGEGEREMLETEAVVEEFVKGGFLKLVAITQLNLEHTSLINVGETNHILRKVELA